MLPGFSIETKPLTELEKKLVPVIVRGLSKKIGPANVVSNKGICAGLLKTCKVNISEARVSKIINHIRMKYLVPGLLANGSGYYISKNPKEIKGYIKSLESRERAINAIRKKTQEYLFELTHKQQQTIFT